MFKNEKTTKKKTYKIRATQNNERKTKIKYR